MAVHDGPEYAPTGQDAVASTVQIYAVSGDRQHSGLVSVPSPPLASLRYQRAGTEIGSFTNNAG
jgi:hypothetical protein